MSAAAADPCMARHFQGLSVRGKVLAEYVWLGGSGTDVHSRTRVLDAAPASPADLPVWAYDGATTGQGSPQCSAVFLKPRAIHPDPFRGGDHILVLCDTFCQPSVHRDSSPAEMQPHPTNNRAPCERVMRAAAGSQPVFSCEQQYTLLNPSTGWPAGWPERAATDPGKSFYCAAGLGSAVGREFAEAHVRACLHAGLRITGANADVVPGQWAYTIGPCQGLELGDQLWLSRYLLLRLSEKFEVVASMDPKPVPGDWSGSGAPVKYSTRETREEGRGWFAIQEHVGRLQATHLQHIMVYGSGNAKRLTGQHKTSSLMEFSVGVENRGASIRIPHSVLLHQRGWYEDRRPGSNMDPYLVSMMLVCSTVGVPLPLAVEQGLSQSTSDSEDPSRSSSAILDELDGLDSFAPNTPPQNLGLLATECSSENSPDGFE